jgi:hypothetical protein
LLVGAAIFPSRTTEWREEWFYPKSHAYEKIVLSGNLTGYQIPFWRTNSVAGSGTMALKIYRKDSTPAMLTFTLPGLNVANDFHDPGQPSSTLNFDRLTNWLHDSARLDVAQPQVQAEARQVMELFKPYDDAAPGSWKELSDRAIAGLRSFDWGGFTMPLAQFGAFGSLFFALLAFPGVCLCLFYLLALPIVKRAHAEGRTEIEAGRWTPPEVLLVRMPTAFWVLFVLGLITFAIAVTGQDQANAGVLLAILPGIGILMIVVVKLHSRRQLQQARERGLWPQSGEHPTLEHVKRLAQAGEKNLAIKLYHQVHNVSCKDARAAVDKLAG